MITVTDWSDEGYKRRKKETNEIGPYIVATLPDSTLFNVCYDGGRLDINNHDTIYVGHQFSVRLDTGE